MISIIDYGLGNLGSIKNMFKWIGADCEIISTRDSIMNAQKIVLPGVGSFDNAMRNINKLGIKNCLDIKALEQRVPILGVCLGMQLLTESSEEGVLPGFGWIKGETKRFNFVNNKIKIPHMGWNIAEKVIDHPIIEGLGIDPRFYFVHSYFVRVKCSKNKLMVTKYGEETFDSAILNDNIFGAQFHPEKSHKFGMTLFKNFASIK